MEFRLKNILKITFAFHSEIKSKCFFKSVDKISSITINLNRLKSIASKLEIKLFNGSDTKRDQEAAA